MGSSVTATGRGYLGSYRLAKQLAASQTCQIWEAVRDSDTVHVAIKALLGKYAKDREQIASLKHEYNVGRHLNHPQVMRVFEYNVDRNTPYMVMEFFSPCNMKRAIREKLDEIAWQVPVIVERAAEGLGFFHTQGWLHRDVKPDNYLIGDDGNVKLIDYSLAQRHRRGLARWLAGKSKVQGTRTYMSPEQIRGEALDARSDIYSFGCTLFELLSGRPPYTGTSSNQLLNKHLKAAVPSVAASNDNVTSEFSGLVAKTMAKRRQHRPESMEQFLKELGEIRLFHVRPRRPTPDGPADAEAEG